MSGWRLYLGLAAGALVIAALSLLIPSTPSYDPWAWLVWGHEIVHLDLHTTGGPSWKPLPMLFTTVFALFGKAQPDLWLIIARAGAIVCVAMVFKIAWRLTRDLVAGVAEPGGTSRWMVLIAPVLAGVIAAGSLMNSGGFISDNALGYSEGFATALALIAVDRYLDGEPRQAFAVGFFAALDRPELWFFWGPYGLYLFWRDPGARRLVVGLFALIPVLWFLPELWGSGHLLRGVTRAQHPRSNSAAFAKCPVCTVFKKEAWPTVLNRVKIPGIIAMFVAAFGLWRTRRRVVAAQRSGRPSHPGSRVAARAGSVRHRLVARDRVRDPGRVLGQQPLPGVRGRAGRDRGRDRVGMVLADDRRLDPPARRVGSGPAAAHRRRVHDPRRDDCGHRPVPRRAAVDRPEHRQPPAHPPRARLPGPPARGPERRRAEGRRQAGAAELRRPVMTEGFQVPMVAWTLGVRTLRVEAEPTGSPGRPGPR